MIDGLDFLTVLSVLLSVAAAVVALLSSRFAVLARRQANEADRYAFEAARALEYAMTRPGVQVDLAPDVAAATAQRLRASGQRGGR